MINIYGLKVSKNATENKIKKAGFVVGSSCYIFKANLYEKSIILNINIDKEDMELCKLEVYDTQLGQQYIKFYTNEYGKDFVCDQVNEKYKSVINELIKKGILEYE